MSELGDSGDIKVPLICRLCASPTEDGVEIFSEKGQEICLPEKISKCLPVLIRADDDLPKGMCTLCQGKLEFCRQFFEQIYNTTVKLLSILREEEGPNIRISFEDQMLQFVRNYANPALCAAKTEEEDDELEDYEEEEVEDNDEDEGEQDDEKKSSVENVVKAEPREVCDVELKEDKEQVRHFLDELLDDYSKDVSGSSKRKRGRPRKRGEISYKEENQEEEDEERPRRVKDGFRSLVPPPLKICVECGLKSSSHQENIDHWTKAHPNQTIMYRCDWEACEYSSTIVTEIKKHRRNHQIQANQLQKCDKCEKYYPPKYLATRHILVHQEGKNFKCKVCEKSFKTPENLKVHNRIHGPDDVKYTHCCDLCGRRFTQKANLESHMRVHTGLRPFSCDFCEKSFSQKGNLDEHRRTHTGEKPYVCDICGSRHTRKGELLLHIRCIHTHERPFQCSYCPKNFQRRDLLRKHERIHTDTRPYGCEFCGKTFTARDKMIVHRRLHTGERPYMCNFCGRGFCESGNLKKHLRVHGKDIPSVIRQNNKGRGAERQDLGDLDKAVIQGGGVNIQPTGPGRMLEAEPKEEEEGGNVSYEEQVKVEEEYRRRSTVDDQENRSQTPAYPQTPQLRADTPQTPLTPHTPQAPDFNLVSSAQRAAEQQGYSLVTSHPQLQQLQQQPYPQFVSHPLLHQIQSNWSAMYSHIQHPPQ
ncbi:zinc finger and SCAN domain-containing protein 2 [Eurytemora carolleeae]|uniref:zinc finger and SCAN domain-containing protein 2 n=1 Tax=Eurytemora carolleeae TaxID=1294199 RepID=UPI000C7767BA|nr:zinc finger and SCAN domain-containing protein 2 [Eurytemora carolleeae]|eukprot:XP_023320079.1 zinc finger and SCAN domain-containing protein 2-like [Eurytemora affinis]